MPCNNVGIYLDSDTSRYHLSYLINSKTFVNLHQTSDFDEFNSLNCDRKIALLHIPFPYDDNFENLVRSLNCDHIFIVGTELHPPIVDFILRNDHKHISYYVCGIINVDLKNSKISQFMDWFETSTYFYKHWLPEILSRLNPYETKARPFDILLGRKKLHRDVVYRNAIDDPAIGIVSYFNSYDSAIGNDPDKWIWEHSGVRMDRTPNWTVDTVQYYGHPISISQIIPFNVYNRTAYSVIAETCFQDNFSFFTEKTAKPIIAKRLFVMFAGTNYLTNLKKLGFQTFDSIIDESYDTESDALIRWKKAWEQMKWLANQPQEEILVKIKPIVEHNFNKIMSTNWYQSFSDQLTQDVARIIAD